MAKKKKKRVSFVGRLGQTVSDVANAASVAATGSEIGVLELAVEDQLNMTRSTRSRKMKSPKKKTVAKGKLIKKKRT